MNIKPCAPYQGQVVQRATITMPDGVSVFKTYFVSITGRAEPTRYEWGVCAITMGEVESMLRNSGIEGVGFVTAFPHITKVFRFAPAVETVLHVRAFHTPELQTMGLDRDDGFTEFACLGEALIAADEYRFWAQSVDVSAYIKQWSEWQCGGIRNPAKLGEYVAAAAAS